MTQRPYSWIEPAPKMETRIEDLAILTERQATELGVEISLLTRQGYTDSIQEAEKRISTIRQYLDQIQAELPKYNPVKTMPHQEQGFDSLYAFCTNAFQRHWGG